MKVSNSYADPVLKNIAIAYANKNFFADRFFPVVPVEKKTGYYFVWDQANLRAEEDLRTGRAESRIVDDEATKTAYGPLKEHSLKTFIEQDLIEQSDITNLEAKRTERLRARMLLNKEVALATLLSDTAVVTQSATISGTSQWSDYANSDPFGLLETMIEEVRTGSMQKANRIAMGKAVWTKLKYHPDTIELLKSQGGGRFTPQLLADWLEVDEVIVLDSQKNTADEGQTASMSDIWGKHVWAYYVNPSPNPNVEEVSAGYHLSLTDGVEVRTWNEEDPEGEWVKAKDYFEAKLVSAGAISLRKSVVA